MSWLKDSANANEIWVLVAIGLLMFWGLLGWIVYELVA